MQNSSPGAPVKKRRSLRQTLRIVLWLVTAIAFAALGFWGGREWGRREAGKDIAEARTEADSRIKQSQSRLAQLEARDQLFSARGALYAAMDELDRRNFGLASSLVRSAGETLGKVDASVAGVDAAQLAQVRDDVSVTQVAVGSNLEAQRARLRDLASRLDALLREAAPAEPAALPK